MKKIFFIFLCALEINAYSQGADCNNANTGNVYNICDPALSNPNGILLMTGNTTPSAQHNTIIGANAADVSGKVELTIYGSGAGRSGSISTNAGRAVLIGVGAGQNYQLTGPSLIANSVMIGNYAGIFASGWTGDEGKNNTYVGDGAGAGQSVANPNRGHTNCFYGASSGFNNTTGNSNCFFGNSTGQFNTSGFNNNFIGIGAGKNNTTGSSNTYIGNMSCPAITNGTGNVALGANSNIGTATDNPIKSIAIGSSANVQADAGISIGAGNNIWPTATRSVTIGNYLSGSSTTSPCSVVGQDVIGIKASAVGGNFSIAIGNGSNTGLNATNSIALGLSSQISSSNSIAIGNNSSVLGAGTNTVAIGASASIIQSNSMLLGAFSAGTNFMRVGINTVTPGNTPGNIRSAQFHIFNSWDNMDADPWVIANAGVPGFPTSTTNNSTHARIRFEMLPTTNKDSAQIIVINPQTGKLYKRSWNWACCSTSVEQPPFVTCNLANFVPKTDPANTERQTCSQIYDNNTGTDAAGMNNATVSIGYPLPGVTSRDFTHHPLTFIGGILSSGSAPPQVPISSTADVVVKLDVNGITRTLGVVAWSDKRYKKDLSPITFALDRIKLLNGVTYNWRKDEFKNINFDNSRQIGFIAQEVAKVIPEAVVINGDGYYAMNYTMLIPVLTEAMKEQQKMIEAQQKEIDELKAIVKGTTPKSILENPVKTIQLFQNVPNPFSKETDIKFFLPETVKQANLTIYDMQGKQLRKIEINERNEASIKINAKELPAGMYMYSLIADGKEMDTKRMILTDY